LRSVNHDASGHEKTRVCNKLRKLKQWVLCPVDHSRRVRALPFGGEPVDQRGADHRSAQCGEGLQIGTARPADLVPQHENPSTCLDAHDHAIEPARRTSISWSIRTITGPQCRHLRNWHRRRIRGPPGHHPPCAESGSSGIVCSYGKATSEPHTLFWNPPAYYDNREGKRRRGGDEHG
jgi:hypothetical protein